MHLKHKEVYSFLSYAFIQEFDHGDIMRYYEIASTSDEDKLMRRFIGVTLAGS